MVVGLRALLPIHSQAPGPRLASLGGAGEEKVVHSGLGDGQKLPVHSTNGSGNSRTPNLPWLLAS